MPPSPKINSSGRTIGSGLLCFVVAILCAYLEVRIWPWIFFTLSGTFVVIGTTQPRVGVEKANNVGLVTFLLLVAVSVYFTLIHRTAPSLIVTAAWFILVTIVSLAVFGATENIRSTKARTAIRLSLPIVLAGALLTIYVFYKPSNIVVRTFLVYFIADNLRRGLTQAIFGSTVVPSRARMAFVIPDGMVILLLLLGLSLYRDFLCFHILAATIAIGLFRFSIESFIPEVSKRERQKLGLRPHMHRHIPHTFFVSISGSHSSLNFLMILLTLTVIYYPIPEYLAALDIQSVVFQASIGLLGIAVAFTTLILSNRLKHSDEGYSKQSYVLGGLFGATFLLTCIAFISFVGMTIKPALQQAGVPTITEISENFLYVREVQIKTAAMLMNEIVFFAIPAALLYFLSLNRDFTERFSHEDRENSLVQ